MMWLILLDEWKTITSEELRKLIENGLRNKQVWRLLNGRQPESYYVNSYGLVRDIFGNVEVL